MYKGSEKWLLSFKLTCSHTSTVPSVSIHTVSSQAGLCTLGCIAAHLDKGKKSMISASTLSRPGDHQLLPPAADIELIPPAMSPAARSPGCDTILRIKSKAPPAQDLFAPSEAGSEAGSLSEPDSSGSDEGGEAAWQADDALCVEGSADSIGDTFRS